VAIDYQDGDDLTVSLDENDNYSRNRKKKKYPGLKHKHFTRELNALDKNSNSPFPVHTDNTEK
jgi:hypothetical protein